MYMYGALGATLLTAKSCRPLSPVYFRKVLPKYFHGFSFGRPVSPGFGWGIGCIFGMLQSTKHTMKTLYALGPDYSLGAMARDEVEEYSIDSSKLYRDSKKL